MSVSQPQPQSVTLEEYEALPENVRAEVIMIVCDKGKLDENRCNGAPDFIIEIVSPGNSSDDYIRKAYYYKNYGVREYWILDPKRRMVTVNYFKGNLINVAYSFDATVKVNICDDLLVNFSAIVGLLGL